MLIDIEKLESTLTANWTTFMNVRSVMQFCLEAAGNNLCFEGPIKISELLITRFCVEPDHSYFTVWLEYKVSDSYHITKVTTECKIDFEGSMKHTQTIEESRQRLGA